MRLIQVNTLSRSTLNLLQSKTNTRWRRHPSRTTNIAKRRGEEGVRVTWGKFSRKKRNWPEGGGGACRRIKSSRWWHGMNDDHYCTANKHDHYARASSEIRNPSRVFWLAVVKWIYFYTSPAEQVTFKAGVSAARNVSHLENLRGLNRKLFVSA